MGSGLAKPENDLAAAIWEDFKEAFEKSAKASGEKVRKEFLKAVNAALTCQLPGAKFIDIDFNGIPLGELTTVGIPILFSAMARCPKLQRVVLSECSLGPQHGAAVNDLIRQTSSINDLVLEGNNLGEDFLASLLDAMTKTASLTRLNLKRTSDTCDVFVSGLGPRFTARSIRLQQLNLGGIKLSPESYALLVDTMSKNVSLQEVVVDDAVRIDPGLRERLNFLMERNTYVFSVIDDIINASCQRNFKTKMRKFGDSIRIKEAPERDKDTPMYKWMADQKRKEAEESEEEERPERFTQSYVADGMRIGESSMKGRRNDMEDGTLVVTNYRRSSASALVGVFDGHGSRDPARYVVKTLPGVLDKALGALTDTAAISEAITAAFHEVNNTMKPWAVYNGTTAAIIYKSESHLFFANCGDTRTLLGTKDKTGIRVSQDHKPDNEVERITAAGGFVKDNRVNGRLAVARSFGDSFYPPVVATPFIHVVPIDPSYDFAVIACDGVWDVVNDEVAISLVSGADRSDVGLVAEKLRDLAYNFGSQDNISVVVVYFDPSAKAAELGGGGGGGGGGSPTEDGDLDDLAIPDAPAPAAAL